MRRRSGGGGALGVLLPVLLLLGLAIIGVRAEEDEDGYAEEKEQSVEFQGTLVSTTRWNLFTRSDLELTESNRRFCGWATNNTSDDPEFWGQASFADCLPLYYAEGILWVFGFGLIGAFVMCTCCGPIVWCCRCCCCGGMHPTYGFCCPGERIDFAAGEGYRKREMMLVRVLAVGTAVTAVFMVISGITGTSLLSSLLPELKTLVEKTVEDVLADVRLIDRTVAETALIQRFLGNDTAIAAPIEDAVNELKAFTDPIYDQAVEYDAIRNGILIGIVLIAGGCFVIFGIGALLGYRKAAWPVNMCPGFIMGAIVWLLFGIHYPMGVLLADVCTEADYALAGNGTGPNEFNAVWQIENCKDSDLFVNLRRTVENAISRAEEAGCDAAFRLCNTTYPCVGAIIDPSTNARTGPQCTLVRNCSTAPCNRYTLATFSDAVIPEIQFGCAQSFDLSQQTGIVDPSECPAVPLDKVCPTIADISPTPKLVCGTQDITIAQCSESCDWEFQRKLAVLAVEGAQAIAAFNKLYDDVLTDFLNCKQPPKFMNGVLNAICVTMLSGTYLIALAMGVLGSLFCFGIPLAFLGLKRFPWNHRRAHMFKGKDDSEEEWHEEEEWPERKPPKLVRDARKQLNRAATSVFGDKWVEKRTDHEVPKVFEKIRQESKRFLQRNDTARMVMRTTSGVFQRPVPRHPDHVPIVCDSDSDSIHDDHQPHFQAIIHHYDEHSHDSVCSASGGSSAESLVLYGYSDDYDDNNPVVGDAPPRASANTWSDDGKAPRKAQLGRTVTFAQLSSSDESSSETSSASGESSSLSSSSGEEDSLVEYN